MKMDPTILALSLGVIPGPCYPLGPIVPPVGQSSSPEDVNSGAGVDTSTHAVTSTKDPK